MSLHSRYVWTWVAIAILIVGTTVALFRQQANFDEHETIDRRVCELSVATRQLIAAGFSTIADNPLVDAQTAQDLQQLNVRAEELVRATRAACHAD